jgi:hypothetical protein
MNALPIIALIDARTAAADGLRGARVDDPQERPVRRRTTPRSSRPVAQPSRKRSEKATRSTGGAKTGSPSKVTA